MVNKRLLGHKLVSIQSHKQTASRTRVTTQSPRTAGNPTGRKILEHSRWLLEINIMCTERCLKHRRHIDREETDHEAVDAWAVETRVPVVLLSSDTDQSTSSLLRRCSLAAAPGTFAPTSPTCSEQILNSWLIEQCLTSPPTQYRLYSRPFYRSKDHWIGLDCAVFYVPTNTV